MIKPVVYDEYFLPVNYKIRKENDHDDERKKTDEYQLEVYLFAKQFMTDNGFQKIIDVGCGSGYKLVHYLGEFDTLGVETEPCLSFLRDTYPNKSWHASGQPGVSFPNSFEDTDLVLCVDVIEHIRNPEYLISYLSGINSKYWIISTPDRYVLTKHPSYIKKYGQAKDGPPVNTTHVREGTYEEFICYLSKFFNVIESRHGKKQIECQWHLCSKKY